MIPATPAPEQLSNPAVSSVADLVLQTAARVVVAVHALLCFKLALSKDCNRDVLFKVHVATSIVIAAF